ncbi:hypothetical protein ABZX30_04385 [Streptomyces sp. NPDC004542]|uniref:hypothetical protein n=1 Tax=Streptomyces sp. NPDC004542 TaxID=3154281 RepID=UPI0033B74705
MSAPAPDTIAPRTAATRSGQALRITPPARPGPHRTNALTHRSDARELQRMPLER